MPLNIETVQHTATQCLHKGTSNIIRVLSGCLILFVRNQIALGLTLLINKHTRAFSHNLGNKLFFVIWGWGGEELSQNQRTGEAMCNFVPNL